MVYQHIVKYFIKQSGLQNNRILNLKSENYIKIMFVNSLETPILFLIFNRPENTQIVFNEIRRVKPKRLFIAADGPRDSAPDDFENCIKSREILKLVDWDCEVKTLLRDKNLGCKIAVSTAISWFFEYEEDGIILEDDCVPDLSFFWFCQELLNKYKNDDRIMMISGMNYISCGEIKESYFFSNYYAIWGWATWRRAWNLYDIDMSNWEEFKNGNYLSWFYKDKKMIDFVQSMLQDAYENKINTWDCQWFYSCLVQNSFSIIPKFNLISNIGVSGAHADNETSVNFLPLNSLEIDSIIHPQFVLPNVQYNQLLYDKLISLIYHTGKFIKFRIYYQKIKKFINKKN